MCVGLQRRTVAVGVSTALRPHVAREALLVSPLEADRTASYTPWAAAPRVPCEDDEAGRYASTSRHDVVSDGFPDPFLPGGELGGGRWVFHAVAEHADRFVDGVSHDDQVQPIPEHQGDCQLLPY